MARVRAAVGEGDAGAAVHAFAAVIEHEERLHEVVVRQQWCLPLVRKLTSLEVPVFG